LTSRNAKDTEISEGDFMLQNFANTPKTGQKKLEKNTVMKVLLQSLIFTKHFLTLNNITRYCVSTDIQTNGLIL